MRQVAVYWTVHTTAVCDTGNTWIPRGGHGPWVPIYGAICVLICFLIHCIGKRSIFFFFISSDVCGALSVYFLIFFKHNSSKTQTNQRYNINIK